MFNANMLNIISQFRKNPMQMLSQQYNIPQNLSDPREIVQHLLNTGQVTQNQVNAAMQMRNNPDLQGLFGK